MQHYDVIIVGAGHGGAQSAIALRQQGFEGSILMIGRESEPPYERPPLSKEYLAGDKPFERLYLRPPGFWSEKNVTLLLGVSVDGISPATREIRLSDGSARTYGRLIWATGGEPRPLACPGAGLSGVHCIRSRADVDGMIAALTTGATRVVIVGGGYIGLEAAAVLSRLGCKIVLIEMENHVLARVSGPDLAAFFEQEHRSRGIDLRTNASVERIIGEDGNVTAAVLASGETIPADLVVAGIGIIPAVGPLLEAGAEGNGGVDVDAFCRTSLPDIYAIGDCAAHPNRFAGGGRIRLESVQNANEMAIIAAGSIAGNSKPYDTVPWFWSNQYDLRIQSVGLAHGHDASVLRGSPASRSFSVVYLRQRRVIALDCVNRVKDFAQGRKLVELGVAIEPAALANVTIPLKTWATEP